MGDKEPQLGIFHEDSSSSNRFDLVQFLAKGYHDNSKKPHSIILSWSSLYCYNSSLLFEKH